MLTRKPPYRRPPVQNSPHTAKNTYFSPFEASREKNIPVQTQTTRAGRTFSRKPPPTSHAAHTPRYKTLPATPASRPNRNKTLPATPASKPNRNKTLPATPASKPNRYKTLPARRKTPISDHLARAGRKLSRPGSKQPEQGELFPANHHPPATQRTRPGTKLSQQPPPQGQTGTKLSQQPPPQSQTGTKLSQQPPPQSQTGTKLSQHDEKRPFQTIWREQGENYHGQEANNPSRENFLPQTTTHQPHRAHTPVQNSPSNPHLKAKPVQNSPHTRRVSPAIHKPTTHNPHKPATHNPHKPAHKRRGPGRLTVCPAPGRSCNDAAQSLTA